MFCGQIISSEIPQLNLQDPVEKALSLMQEHGKVHLPVTDGEKFLGLVSENDLLEIGNEKRIEDVADLLLQVSVRSTDFFSSAVQLSYRYDLDIIPVAGEHQEYEGSVTREELFMLLAKVNGVEEQGSLLVLEMPKNDFAPGQINKLVESNDAFITHLNTWQDHSLGVMMVQIRINKEEISDIIATFQRFGYIIRYYHGEELYRNELQSNLDNLFNYLNM
ncbi:MAG: CBS domain-containing protein [Chitinophagaceae bacterium]